MKTFILISCSSTKSSSRTTVENLYTSSLFKKSLGYAKSLNPDGIFVLSAKHGLLKLDQKIYPYNQTLNDMSINQRKEWSIRVLKKLERVMDFQKDKVIFLTGKNYREFLLNQITNYEIPVKGLRIGEQLKFLTSTSQKLNGCEKLHLSCNNLKRHYFPFDGSEIPPNGIYILFERGERGHGVDRIVRIGTHTGDNQLKSRLKQHFLNENKDRSIFRKNIGRSLLKKGNDPYFKIWEIDFTSRKVRDDKGSLLDPKKQNEIEKRVSKIIQNNFSFVFIPVDEKEKRLKYESKLISTVSHCNQCKPSSHWLGNYSPKEKIRESGLWLVNELYKEPFSDEELSDFIKNYLKR